MLNFLGASFSSPDDAGGGALGGGLAACLSPSCSPRLRWCDLGLLRSRLLKGKANSGHRGVVKNSRSCQCAGGQVCRIGWDCTVLHSVLEQSKCHIFLHHALELRHDSMVMATLMRLRGWIELN